MSGCRGGLAELTALEVSEALIEYAMAARGGGCDLDGAIEYWDWQPAHPLSIFVAGLGWVSVIESPGTSDYEGGGWYPLVLKVTDHEDTDRYFKNEAKYVSHCGFAGWRHTRFLEVRPAERTVTVYENV